MYNKNNQRRVVRRILGWYKRHGRRLPWRLPVGQPAATSNPYRILISEIMLQQTQVSRVLIKYPLFLRRFPTLQSLAKAAQRDVVMEWRGMGYNNRAVRLHKLAQIVVDEYRGRIPREYDQLVSLPGIGKYTANALRASAFGVSVPVVDVNVQRVFSRIFWRMRTTRQAQSLTEIWTFAGSILPHGRSYDWNQALMDLGAQVCTARNPRCEECPVRTLCTSRSSMARAASRKQKHEPSRNGIPNRIYRGRIVDILRHVPNERGLAADQLGKQVHRSFGRQHTVWFQDLLAKLQDDGLIKMRGNGTLKTQFVSLA